MNIYIYENSKIAFFSKLIHSIFVNNNNNNNNAS